MTTLAVPSEDLRIRDREGWQANEPRIRTAAVPRPEPVPVHSAKSRAALWTVPTDGGVTRLVQPVMVTIRAEEGYFFAENETLSLVGIGQSREQAVDDFVQHLAYYKEYYDGLPEDRVTGPAVELKRLYATLFRAG